MNEILETGLSQYDLESLEIDWSTIEPIEKEKGSWEFVVPNRQVGRKIGYEVSKGYPESHHNSVRWLTDPTPISDLRLSGQVSFREYDEDDNNTGDIRFVTIVLQHYANLPEIFDPFDKAIKPVLAKITQAREK